MRYTKSTRTIIHAPQPSHLLTKPPPPPIHSPASFRTYYFKTPPLSASTVSPDRQYLLSPVAPHSSTESANESIITSGELAVSQKQARPKWQYMQKPQKRSERHDVGLPSICQKSSFQLGTGTELEATNDIQPSFLRGGYPNPYQFLAVDTQTVCFYASLVLEDMRLLSH